MRKSLVRTTTSVEQQQEFKDKFGIPMFEELFERNERIIDNILSSRNNKIKCVVPISGGKDSQVCLIKALEIYNKDEILGLFCDVKFEHPLTIEHIEKIKDMYGVEIITISDGSVESYIKREQWWPSYHSRFCTKNLKIRAAKKFYIQLAEKQNAGFQVWMGLRLGESAGRNNRYKSHNESKSYPPHEIDKDNPKFMFNKLNIEYRLPILTWEEEDVYELLGDDCNELYKNGFDRVGCFPCFASGDKAMEKAFAFDEVGAERRELAVKLSDEMKFSVFRSKGGKERNPDMVPDEVSDKELRAGPDVSEDIAPCGICNM